MKNLALALAFVASSIATAQQASPGQLIARACGGLSARQKAICGLLIEQEISANMGSVVEQEGPRYLARQSVMRSTGAFMIFFDRVQQKVGGKIPGQQRIQIQDHGASYSIGALIQVVDSSIVK